MSNSQVLYARQPIVDKALKIYGYELLFRTEGPFSITDGNYATSQVLLNAFNEGDVEEFMKGGRAFVNFTKELLMQPPPFNKAALVIEILETIEITQEVVNAIKALSENGFQLALDDYTPDTGQDELLPYVSIVKLEFPAISHSSLPAVVSSLKSANITVLAEKIETHDDFKLCNQLGCDLFQGFFFSKPELVKGQKLPQNKLAVMELIAKVQSPQIAIEQVIKTITVDPFLSVKLLQLVNSASFRRTQTIGSIHMAVMLLGIDRVKAWATLLALANIDDKPKVLINVALVRARMCELIANTIEPAAADTYFTVGLFSCLEAFFDQPLAGILTLLPLDPRIVDALLKMKGKPGLALNTVLHLEKGNFEAIHWSILATHQLTGPDLNQMYRDSIQFANKHSSF